MFKISNLFLFTRIKEALGDPDWKLAIKEKINALEKNETWEIVDIPIDKTIVGCNCVFTVKYKADGSLERYKASLRLNNLPKPME